MRNALIKPAETVTCFVANVLPGTIRVVTERSGPLCGEYTSGPRIHDFIADPMYKSSIKVGHFSGSFMK